MLWTNDSKSSTKSYTIGKFRTLLWISYVCKTVRFSFDMFRTVKLTQQIVANLNCSYFKGPLFIEHNVYHIGILAHNVCMLVITDKIPVEGHRGAGTRENRGGRWAGSGRRWSGMRESCEGGRREKNERH